LSDRLKPKRRSFAQVGAALALLLIYAASYLGLLTTRRAFGELAETRDKLASANADLRDQILKREEIESQLRQSQKMEATGN
jgi:CHASE3 domain sensor protein